MPNNQIYEFISKYYEENKNEFKDPNTLLFLYSSLGKMDLLKKESFIELKSKILKNIEKIRTEILGQLLMCGTNGIKSYTEEEFVKIALKYVNSSYKPDLSSFEFRKRLEHMFETVKNKISTRDALVLRAIIKV